MVCFPYTLLIGEFWKVPKKRDKSPVLYLHVVCFLPTGHCTEPGPSAGKLLARAACVVGSTSRPPAGATPLPYQALVSLFTVTSVDNIQQWGCTIKHYIHIKSNPSVPPCVPPCSLKCGVLVTNSKASEAFDVPGCYKSQG